MKTTPETIIDWASKTAAATNRGGARKGSGRKPVAADTRRLTVIVTAAQFEALDALAEDHGLSRSEALRNLLEGLDCAPGADRDL